MSDKVLTPAEVAEKKDPTLAELCPLHDLGRDFTDCDCPPDHPNRKQLQESIKLTVDQVTGIAARYDGFDQADPACTCTRTDVDFYDTSGCERCDSNSDFSRAYRNAKYQLELHGAQDICSLCDSHEALRAEITRLRGLIEGMGHEAQCQSVKLRRKCNCIKSKVNL